MGGYPSVKEGASVNFVQGLSKTKNQAGRQSFTKQVNNKSIGEMYEAKSIFSPDEGILEVDQVY